MPNTGLDDGRPLYCGFRYAWAGGDGVLNSWVRGKQQINVVSLAHDFICITYSHFFCMAADWRLDQFMG